MKKINYQIWLKGSTLIEVIVASVILLVGFLLFSAFVSQLYSERNINDEMRAILSFSFLQEKENTQSVNADEICSQCILKSTNHSIHSRIIYIQKGSNNKEVIKYYEISSSKEVDSLFQQ